MGDFLAKWFMQNNDLTAILGAYDLGLCHSQTLISWEDQLRRHFQMMQETCCLMPVISFLGALTRADEARASTFIPACITILQHAGSPTNPTPAFRLMSDLVHEGDNDVMSQLLGVCKSTAAHDADEKTLIQVRQGQNPFSRVRLSSADKVLLAYTEVRHTKSRKLHIYISRKIRNIIA